MLAWFGVSPGKNAADQQARLADITKRNNAMAAQTVAEQKAAEKKPKEKKEKEAKAETLSFEDFAKAASSAHGAKRISSEKSSSKTQREQLAQLKALNGLKVAARSPKKSPAPPPVCGLMVFRGSMLRPSRPAPPWAVSSLTGKALSAAAWIWLRPSRRQAQGELAGRLEAGDVGEKNGSREVVRLLREEIVWLKQIAEKLSQPMRNTQKLAIAKK